MKLETYNNLKELDLESSFDDFGLNLEQQCSDKIKISCNLHDGFKILVSSETPIGQSLEMRGISSANLVDEIFWFERSSNYGLSVHAENNHSRDYYDYWMSNHEDGSTTLCRTGGRTPVRLDIAPDFNSWRYETTSGYGYTVDTIKDTVTLEVRPLGHMFKTLVKRGFKVAA